MSQMKELYEKVAAESALQVEFAAIMKEAEKADADATQGKLIAFAKDAGYDVTMEELQTFFKELVAPKEGELSDGELDQVAGGKTTAGDIWNGAKTEWHWFSDEPADKAWQRWGGIIGGWF